MSCFLTQKTGHVCSLSTLRSLAKRARDIPPTGSISKQVCALGNISSNLDVGRARVNTRDLRLASELIAQPASTDLQAGAV